MKLTLVLLTTAFLSFFSSAQFPGCPNVDAGPDQTLNCSTPCATLTAIPFEAGATTSYSVNSIPHNPPIPYNQPGTGVSIGTDDVWSPAITLPFNFCFYGVNYTQILVGSNGNLSFNVANAGGYCPWSYSATCPSTTLATLPAGNIFGVYHDIDPSVCGNIKWNLVGTSPCRIFVVSFDQICQFSCTSITSRHMMVLYETTNAIDVYVESKPTCGGWNSGNALIGIQNPAGTAGITPPGRNTGAWTVSTPEAWRFLPNGAPIYTLEWLEGVNVIGTTAAVSVCPSTATTYTARATYTRCDGTTVVEEDQVIVNPANTGLLLTQNTNTPASCGQSNGSFSVTASGGTPNYTYSIDNITYQPGSTFGGLPVGNYVAYVQDAAGCVSTLNTAIIDASTLSLAINQVQNVLCNGTTTGSINSIATGGTAPYSFSINGGAISNSGSFTNLPAGNYTILVTDNSGCTYLADTLITEPTPLSLAEIGTINSMCNLPNGSLEVSASGGVSPFTYSIDNGITTQNNGVFGSINASNYTVLVTDNNGCQNSLLVTVNADNAPTISVVSNTNVSCFNGTNGSVTVTAVGGALPYSFSLNGGPIQAGTQFTNLVSGTYNLSVTDGNGCISTTSVIITQPVLLSATASANQTICEGTTVTITNTVNGGTSPYNYAWSNGINSSSNSVTPVSTTTYNLIVTDANGCTANASSTITVLPLPIALGQNAITSGYSPLTVTFDNLSTNATNYVWEFNNGQTITTASLASQNSTFIAIGDFTIILTASNGICESSWSTIITVIPYDPLEVYVPNVFSPNNDDSNDAYFITTKNAKSMEGVIIDRWGLTMVEFNDINYKWDGKVKGTEALEGTYFIKYKVVGLDTTIKEGHTFFQLVR